MLRRNFRYGRPFAALYLIDDWGPALSAVVSTTSRVTCPRCGQSATLTVHASYEGQESGNRRFDFSCATGCSVPVEQLRALTAGKDVA